MNNNHGRKFVSDLKTDTDWNVTERLGKTTAKLKENPEAKIVHKTWWRRGLERSFGYTIIFILTVGVLSLFGFIEV